MTLAANPPIDRLRSAERQHESAGRSNLRQAFADAAVFRGLDSDDVSALTEPLQPLYFAAGQRIFVAGDPGDRFYLLAEGKVKMGSRSPDSREHLVRIVGPSESFGELSVLDAAPRSLNATALTDVVAVSVDRGLFAAWTGRHPRMKEQLLRLLSRRLRRTDVACADMTSADVSARVAKRLLELAQRFGVREHGAVRVTHDLSQEEIAQLVGASREHVNRVLSDFSQRGWIRVAGKSVLITDSERLLGRAS